MEIYEIPEMDVIHFDKETISCLTISEGAQFAPGESDSADDWLTP